MASLYLLRHAKSDWSAPQGGDHERPLNSRGRRSAERIGRFLRRLDEVPQRVLVSSARRTRETVELAAGAGDWKAEVEATEALYEAPTGRVLDTIRRQGGGADRLLVVGHQPTLSDLAGALIGEGRLAVVTAALLRIDFRIEGWQQLTVSRGELIWMVVPRMLEAAGIAD